MALGKKILKSPFTQMLLSRLLSGMIKLVYLTSRIRYQMPEASKPYMHGKTNAIFAFWHGRMMMFPPISPPNHIMHVLISHHGDGRLISSTIGHFRLKTIAGSTSRGGLEAANGILRMLEVGDNISITPDGPRGPLQTASKGIITIAKRSGKPIIPVTFSSTRATRFKSWDRFMLALPFGRVVYYVGEPMFVDQNADDETALLEFEKTMNRLVIEADEATHG